MRSHEEIYKLIYRNHKEANMAKGMTEDSASRAANILAVKITHEMFIFWNKAVRRKHWTAYPID